MVCGTRSDSLRRLKEFRLWALAQPVQHVVLVGGNHDLLLDALGRQEVRRLLHPVQYLEDECVKIMGLNIWGGPCCPDWCGPEALNRAFCGADASDRLVAVPRDVDIIMTHMFLPWKRELGQPEVAVLQSGAQLHVCGHINGAYGI